MIVLLYVVFKPFISAAQYYFKTRNFVRAHCVNSFRDYVIFFMHELMWIWHLFTKSSIKKNDNWQNIQYKFHLCRFYSKICQNYIKNETERKYNVNYLKTLTYSWKCFYWLQDIRKSFRVENKFASRYFFAGFDVTPTL